MIEYMQVRNDTVNLMRKLLIGPMLDDEILESGPSDTYLTGILWPIDTTVSADEDEQLEVADGGPSDTEEIDESVPLFSVYKPSSIGLTCIIAGSCTPFDIIINGARYVPEKAEEGLSLRAVQGGGNEDGTSSEKSRIKWMRKPVCCTIRINGDEQRHIWRTNDFISPNGSAVVDNDLTVHINRRVRDDNLIVTATLINTVTPGSEFRQQYNLYQTSLEIQSPGTDSVSGNIISRPNISYNSDGEAGINSLLYRNVREFAVGHGVSAVWDDHANDRVSCVRTEWMPYCAVPSVSPEGHQSLKTLQENEFNPFSAELLSRASNRQKTIDALSTFCDVYEKWIDLQVENIDQLPDIHHAAAKANTDNCRQVCSRMRQGISLISDDDSAFRAFCLANRAMDDQSQGKQRGVDSKPLVWRPFQLAFMLMTIYSIANPADENRNCVDLLWFPTGGGKTEAYLGLAAFVIFHRRLRNENPDVKSVDVLMRYTLRLLTVQQFQRAAAMICAADKIRSEDAASLGNSPISIGLYVGEGATPNKILGEDASAQKALEKEKINDKPASTPRLLLKCPLCGHSLSPDDYHIDESTPSMEIICPDEANCPSSGKPLPVYTVDDDIYRELPSLLIGTVDKFAQLPRKAEVGKLLGCSTNTPPALIIQDELHLISGPLGTMVGLYETAIDGLCARDGVLPKVIGSTATIGRARQQVLNLFNREVMQFPPSGIDLSDSFFAVRDHSGPNRLYIGLSSSGRSPKFALQAATSALMQISQYLLDTGNYSESALDPYWSCLLYFNSLRELGGAKVMMKDDVRRSISFYSSRLGNSNRTNEREPVELTSRIPSNRIPEILEDLEVTIFGDPNKGAPADTILASNMISVGMDIPRLGLMIVNGQPKATSEYIQATSRVGRSCPGIIITVFNAGRPRDLSHFEHFLNYHNALYRGVEATSVTPWAPRARDKALHAILAALVRHSVPGMVSRFGAINFDMSLPDIEYVKNFIINRAASAGKDHSDIQEVIADLERLQKSWEIRADRYRDTGTKFEYWATPSPYKRGAVNPHLMRSAEDPVENHEVWRTPNSMREVEPSAYCTPYRPNKAF